MKRVISFINEEQEIYNLNRKNNVYRGSLIHIHTSDLHFGKISAKYQYDILNEQFLNKISQIHFDILSIDGDIFDHKFMSNSDVIMYASLFINKCVEICRSKKATFIIIAGTKSHDDDQLKLFYHYLTDPTVDVRIVEDVKFEYVKGAKILCIPELYGKDDEYYNKFLFKSGSYDMVFMHGEFKGSIYDRDNKGESHIFDMNDFSLCRGPIISGHVHTGGCFESYFYYNGTPYQMEFGDDNTKGFLIVLHNLDTGMHYTHLEPIESFRYVTLNLDHMLISDPKQLIEYVNGVKQDDNIKYIRLEFIKELTDTELANLEIIKNYYRGNNNIKFKVENYKVKQMQEANTEILDKYKEYQYILDKNLSEYEILSRYINQQKGYTYITADELIKLLQEEV